MNQHFAGTFFALFLTFSYFWLKGDRDPLIALCAVSTATACALLLATAP